MRHTIENDLAKLENYWKPEIISIEQFTQNTFEALMNFFDLDSISEIRDEINDSKKSKMICQKIPYIYETSTENKHFSLESISRKISRKWIVDESAEKNSKKFVLAKIDEKIQILKNRIELERENLIEGEIILFDGMDYL